MVSGLIRNQVPSNGLQVRALSPPLDTEPKRMVSRHIGNVLPGNGLRVRPPWAPLDAVTPGIMVRLTIVSWQRDSSGEL